jgi:alpha-L-rhamnosidase
MYVNRIIILMLNVYKIDLIFLYYIILFFLFFFFSFFFFLVITGMGYYRAFFNGMRLGRNELDPAWTNYPNRLLYNVYDLTKVIAATGQPNALAVYLGNGWPNIVPNPFNGSDSSYEFEVEARGIAAVKEYMMEHPNSSPISPAAAIRLTGGMPRSTDNTNAVRKLRAQLRVTYSDGTVNTLYTNAASFDSEISASTAKDTNVDAVIASSWSCGTGALLMDDVYNGCTWDATKETVGWDMPNYAPGAGWPAAVLAADPGGNIGPTLMSAQTMPAVEIVDMIEAMTVNEVKPGVFVFDLGQNIAGYVRLRLPAPVPGGINVTVRHAELLMHPPYGPQDGSIYVGNLRTALATDTYTTVASEADDLFYEYVKNIYT